MSRTLFLYIFKDLFKIFIMASGALAGIMSFGGLLRPLMREGLDAGQVTRMLAYFGPAMTTYSFPVAALFATAVVYGRLAADNELTACKAGGISLLSLTVSGPALVLGLIVAITSLLFLCFVVPASTLEVEKVIYSNLAKLVQSRIERNHQIELENTTIFAQEAHVVLPEASVAEIQKGGIPTAYGFAAAGGGPAGVVKFHGGDISSAVQEISLNGAVGGGSYTVTCTGTPDSPLSVTTAPIKFILDNDAYNGFALEEALNAALGKSGVLSPAVSVASSAPGTYLVTFGNQLAARGVNLLTVNTSGLRSRQLVELIGVEIIAVERDPTDKTLLVPKEFYTASRAYVYIDTQPDEQEVTVTVTLEGGFKFPRRYEGATVAGITMTQYGPISIPSPIKEDVKFMNVLKLKELYADLSKSRRLRSIISEFVATGQRNAFLDELYKDLSGPKRQARFKVARESYSPRFRFFSVPMLEKLSVEKDTYYSLSVEEHGTPLRSGNEVTASGPLAHVKEAPNTAPAAEPAETQQSTTQSVATESINRPIIFRAETQDSEPLIVLASSVVVHAQPIIEEEKYHVTISLRDCLQVTRGGTQGNFMKRAKYDQSFEFPMTKAARAMAGQSIDYYEEHAQSLGSGADKLHLLHDKTALINSIIAESNGRASFAVSCLILVMVGSALGMMFRSGNFLTAFAVSFIPALLSITLIIAGQRTAANVPFRFDGGAAGNPLQLGLGLVWTGNAINLVLAIGLLWKLEGDSRQLMKILDRYVIVSFIKNYCISFMVLVGMYVVLDMVFNFNNMVQFQAQASAIETVIGTLRDMADYYFYQCFLFFVHLSGIIPVVAACFTLMRLTRFNELTAMLAAGVPLLRIAMPIVLVALLLNALLIADQELLIPNMIPKLVRDHDEIHKEAKNFFTIDFMQDADDGLMHVSRYYPHGRDTAVDPRPMMVKLDILERTPVEENINGARVVNLKPSAHINADMAYWNPRTQGWDLINGQRVTGIDPTESRSPEVPLATYKSSNITPEEINLYRSGNYVDLLSTERINELLDRPKSYGRLSLLRVKHSRFTQPLMNVFLLLLAIPCVLTREPGKLKSGASKCLIWMALGLGSVFLTAQMAANPPQAMAADRWAALMAWLPIFIFGPLSVFFLDRIKT